ncbi:MAG TPA: SDR family oxidoreductase [Phototrophicaceae bacterium]|nr:SDR family oxidoreductase [Phototrophicaceae bacterium]
MSQPILIAGASGGVGRQLVGKLTAQDQDVYALVRDLELGQKLFAGQACLHVFEGDARLPKTLPPALAGVRAVICTIRAKAPVGASGPEKIDYEGVRNLVDAARAAGIIRFILVSSIAVTHPNHPFNNFGRALDWKLRGEEALRAADLNSTIVRPGTLTDESGGKTALKIAQGDQISAGKVSRSDLASICLAALDDISTYHTTFEVIADYGDPPKDLNALFAGLKTDRELTVSA